MLKEKTGFKKERVTDRRSKAVLSSPPTTTTEIPATFITPQSNSSNFQTRKLINLKNNDKFDPETAFANLFLNDSKNNLIISNLNSRVTKTATNVNRSTRQYQPISKNNNDNDENKISLLPAYTNSRNKPLQVIDNTKTLYGEHQQQKLGAGRAKKNLNKKWVLDRLDLKPKFDEFIEVVQESDAISIPYPTLKASPIEDESSLGLFKPCLSISSLNINFDDSKRWLFYQTRIDSSDFT